MNNTASENSQATQPMYPRRNNNVNSQRTQPMYPRQNYNNNVSSQATQSMYPRQNNNNNRNSENSVETVFEFISRDREIYGFDEFSMNQLRNMVFLDNETPDEFIFNKDYGVLNHANRGIPIVLDQIYKVMIFKRKRQHGTTKMKTTRYIRKYYNFFIPNRVSEDIFTETQDEVNTTQQLNSIYKDIIVDKAIQNPNKHFIIRVDPRIAKVTDMNTKELTNITLLDVILYTRYNLYMIDVIRDQFLNNEEYHYIYERDTGLISGYTNNLSMPLDPEYTYTEPNIRYEYVIPMEHPLVKEYMNKYNTASKLMASTIYSNRIHKRARYPTSLDVSAPLEVSGGGKIKYISNKDII